MINDARNSVRDACHSSSFHLDWSLNLNEKHAAGIMCFVTRKKEEEEEKDRQMMRIAYFDNGKILA